MSVVLSGTQHLVSPRSFLETSGVALSELCFSNHLIEAGFRRGTSILARSSSPDLLKRANAGDTCADQALFLCIKFPTFWPQSLVTLVLVHPVPEVWSTKGVLDTQAREGVEDEEHLHR